MSLTQPVPNVNPEPIGGKRPFKWWKGGELYQQKLHSRPSEETVVQRFRIVHELARRNGTIAPPPVSPVSVLARMSVIDISALVQVLAGPHRSENASANAQECADVIEHQGGTLAEAEAIYHWAIDVESDLGRVGAGEPAGTPWSDMLWDYSINLATLARTATFVSEMAQGLMRKA